MRQIPLSEILDAPSLWRRHLINSISGYKSANLVGTISPDGVPNLSLISSLVHLGATPPLQGFVMRPLSVERQTYEYIKSTGQYIKLAMQYEDEYEIKQNGTILIIGSIQAIHIDEACLLEDGNLDLSVVDDVAISGLETYYKVEKEKKFAFARVGQWPS